MRFIILLLSLLIQWNVMGININIHKPNHTPKALKSINTNSKEHRYKEFRYYDPSMGTYISKDPIGLVGLTREDDLKLDDVKHIAR